MGETTAVAHGGNPQDRAASPRPRCIAVPCSLFPTIYRIITDIKNNYKFRIRH
ncbi:hypothetical protein [Moorena sp. SIO4G3]|uniref:hypothetical protein n=1 Tax=Moorena sp. SIO4G3 TaxID=2607821 RepID=UPI00142ABF4E|nr:hypothetical protein [Moorena sp. SIO4G3]NEO75027.1 hypothetical protein [Moorena sp. SIO4G3]